MKVPIKVRLVESTAAKWQLRCVKLRQRRLDYCDASTATPLLHTIKRLQRDGGDMQLQVDSCDFKAAMPLMGFTTTARVRLATAGSL